MADDDDRDDEETGEGKGEEGEGDAEKGEGDAEEGDAEEGEGEADAEEGDAEEGDAEEGDAEEGEGDAEEGEEGEEGEGDADAEEGDGEEGEGDAEEGEGEEGDAEEGDAEEGEEGEEGEGDAEEGDDDDEGDDEEGDAEEGEEGMGDDETTEEDEDDWASQEFEPLGVDEDALGSWEDYPDAEKEDFEEDAGDWTVDDYTETAKNLFAGTLEHFGDTSEQRYAAAGYAPVAQENKQGFLDSLTQHVPHAVESLGFFSKDNQVSALGFVTTAGLGILRKVFPNLDLSSLHVTLPSRDTPTRAPEELPPTLSSVNPADKVDLRKYCTPVGDQGQTSRCAAFAWTHAAEMSGNILDHPMGRLSPTYAMMQFQKRQGDFRDHEYAHKGGDGTGDEAQPGPTLAQEGTCTQELWPDDESQPRASEEQLAQDAQQHRLPATVSYVGIDDLKKVLTAGCPVVLAMNTGKAFSAIGRDGIVDAAESPSGKHGRHAMLIVGYVSNYYIVKNSWGTDWGDGGYCYIPKKVLADANPEFEAVLLRKGVAPSGGPRGSSGGGRAGEAPTEGGGASDPGVPPTPPSPPLSAWQAPAVETPTLSVAGPSTLSAVQPSGLAVGPSLLRAPSQTPPAPAPAATPQLRCAACGATVAQGKFCPACGKPLAAPARRVCPRCGVEVKPSDKFCSGCGAAVST
jgi:hypothetical protein